jgi:clorobiocin biosynthesis protein Clo-hal
MVESADAIVVGGGPAGSTAAILLKQYNPSSRIVLFEKEKFPRHHIGESTLPDANAVLQKLGVIDTINRAGFPIKCGFTYKWRHNRPIFIDLFSEGVHPNLQERLYPKGLPDHSWQVERGRYDLILLDRAREVGVEVHEETQVVGVLRGEGDDQDRVLGVRFQSKGDSATRTLSARHTVDASGQGRKISGWLKVETEKFPLADIALYRYYRGFTWREDLIGSFFDGKIFITSVPRGWMWFIPISEEMVGVGLVTRKGFLQGVSPDQAFEEELTHAAEIQDMLAGATRVSHVYSSDPPQTYVIQDWTYRNAQLAGPGWYLVGDAAAFVDPVLSSGMNIAHNCALLAANAINTEWNHPEVPAEAVREGYQTLYREIYGSFLAMAAWWYERRETDNLEDWWKLARAQSRSQSAVANISDRDAFLAFTAGYVTDFRFFNIGAGGFGEQGLNYIFDNIPDEPIEEKLYRPAIDLDTLLVRVFDRFGFDSYYGSHVGTDRWWKLPSITFHRGDERIPFYPSIMESEDEEELLLVDLSARVADRTLAYLDGTRSASQVARALQSDFGGFDQKVHRYAMKVMDNLLTVGLLRMQR